MQVKFLKASVGLNRGNDDRNSWGMMGDRVGAVDGVNVVGGVGVKVGVKVGAVEECIMGNMIL